MKPDVQLENRMKRRQLSHAYLISGEKREELANLLAAASVCTGTTPPCGQCSGCRKAAAGIHPDIFRADREGEGLKAEQVRALRADAYIRPNEAPKKVYILEHGEKLNQTGQNILLKLIEEGPAYGVFLFLTPNPEMLLSTIRSRCEQLRAEGEGMQAERIQQAETLFSLLETGGTPETIAALLPELEKKKREEFAPLLDQLLEKLVACLPQRPELLPVAERLEQLRGACEFPVSPGHLAGWLIASL